MSENLERRTMGILGAEDAQRIDRIGTKLVEILDAECGSNDDAIIAVAVVTMLQRCVYTRFNLKTVEVVPIVTPDKVPDFKEGL